MALAATNSVKVSQEVLALMNTGKFFSKFDPEIQTLEKELSDLRKISPAEGYIGLSALAMLCGDYTSMRSRFNIALNQGISMQLRLNYAHILMHSGFFSEAVELLKKHWDSNELIAATARTALTLYQYKAFMNILSKLESLDLNEDDKDAIEFGLVFSNFAQKYHLDEDDMVRLLDEAGAILRSHSTYYLDAPNIKSFVPHDGGGDPYMVCHIQVPVDADVASNLTMELAEKVFDNPITSKVVVGFRGV